MYVCECVCARVCARVCACVYVRTRALVYMVYIRYISLYQLVIYVLETQKFDSFVKI